MKSRHFIRVALLALLGFAAMGSTYTNTPTVSRGDMINETWLNTYVGENGRFFYDRIGSSAGKGTGCRLRTHPETDKAAYQVQLVTCAEVTLNDGQTLTDWTLLTADITTPGANGLDSGSEAASRWYSVWAIYNGTTRALLLHEEKRNSFEALNDANDSNIGLRDASARTRLAQGFQYTATAPPTAVDLTIAKVGTPTGQLWVTIQGDSGGNPNGTDLATSDRIDVSGISTTAMKIRIPIRDADSLTLTTQYHVVVQGSFAISGANYLNLRYKATTNPYASGSLRTYDGATWTSAANDDLQFCALRHTGDTALTMPSGYTTRAKLGYVRNDGSSNFIPFMAHDHFVTPLVEQEMVGAGTSLVPPLLFDASAFVPPVSVKLAATIQGTASVATLLCPVPDGFAPSYSASFRNAGCAGVYPGAEASVTNVGPILTELQALYGSQASSTSGSVTVDWWEW